MRVHRFQSPFEHWVSGLLVEIAVFCGYLLVLAALVLVTTWVV
ncbi:MAG: hypothetical protein Q8K89_09780 [Actinomycetota bacterium]|nr:hypothetical protein [Actinomycetota bacterium]